MPRTGSVSRQWGVFSTYGQRGRAYGSAVVARSEFPDAVLVGMSEDTTHLLDGGNRINLYNLRGSELFVAETTYGQRVLQSTCRCGCGLSTNWNRRGQSQFRQGHDARLRGRLVRLGRRGDARAIELLSHYGWTRFLTENVYGRRNSVNAVTNGLSRTGRTFGVEIEFNGITRTVAERALRDAGIDVRVESYNHRTRRHWKITTDASVSGTGLECVSPILSGEWGFDQLKRVMNALREAGATVDRSCGTHVHHGVNDLTREQFCDVVRTWTRLQTDSIDTLVSRSRRNANTYCRHLSQYEVDSITASFSASGNPGHVDRFRSLNVMSYPKYGTIEVRQHQGTLSFGKISRWVRLGQAIIESVMHGTHTRIPNTVEGMLGALNLSNADRTFLVGRARTLGATGIGEQWYERAHREDREVEVRAPEPMPESVPMPEPDRAQELIDILDRRYDGPAHDVVDVTLDERGVVQTRPVTFRDGRTVNFRQAVS